MVRLLFTALAQHIAASLPPEAEMTEAQKLYSRLWGGLIAKLAETGLDATPGEPSAEAVEQAAAPAALPPPATPPATPPAASADEPAATTTAAIPAKPDGVAVLASAFPRRRWINRGLGASGRRLPGGQPPPRRLCYAACAGPP